MNEAVAAARALARERRHVAARPVLQPRQPAGAPRAPPARRSGRRSTAAWTASSPASAPAARSPVPGGFLKERNPACRVVAVEPAASAVLSGGAPGPAPDPGHRRRLRPAGARPRPGRRDRRGRGRGRARDRAAGRAPGGRARRHLVRRRAVGRAPGRRARGGARLAHRPPCCPTPASATSRRRSSPPSPSRSRGSRCCAPSTPRRRPLGAPAPRSARPPRGRVRAAGGQPARRPGAAAALGLPPAGRGARPPAAAALGLRDPGLHGPARHVGQPRRRWSRRPRADRRDVRRRRVPRRAGRVRRRLDGLRRLAVVELGGDRALPGLPVRRGRPVRRRALPDARRAATGAA